MFKLFILGLMVLSTPLLAQSHAHHNDHNMAIKGSDSAASHAFAAANARMHAGMDITFSGNVDIDFLRGMIPHHQGAVDMAHILLNHESSDHRVKRLAREIIRTQNGEIALMKRLLEQNIAKHKGYQDKAWLGEDDTHADLQ